MTHSRGSGGSATILALLMTGVIITVGIGFNWLVKEHLRAADGMKRKSEAMIKAASTFNTLMYSILAGRVAPGEIVFNTSEDLLGVKSIPLDNNGVSIGEDIEIKVQDSNGMISLVGSNLTALQRLLHNVTPEENKGAIIIDSYLDWTSRGNLSRLNGAKDAFYKAEGKPYTSRNYPMQYKYEFAFVRGMDGELYKKIAPYVTLLPNSGFNPNTASEEVLMAHLDISRDSAQRLKMAMSETPVSSNPALMKIVQRTIGGEGEGIDFAPSPFLEITIDVGKPVPVYSIKAGVDTRWNATYPYAVIYWGKG
ncbi:MAG: general secretion pathway protein GspK [Nitrospirae bacterium]|nr:general secretion pathway protein GspK [Nitrospirota bacterium]